MKKIADFIVNKRYIVLAAMLTLCIACGVMIPSVNINTDMTKYLPDDSSMKTGMDIMGEEFAETSVSNTIRVMFKDLTEEQKTDVLSQLEEIQYVDSVDYDAESGNKDEYTLFTVNTSYDYGSKEETSIEDTIEKEFSSYEMTYKNDNTGSSELPLWLICLAFGLMMIVLFAMCASWTEPFLFLATIGIAIVINMGSNLMFDSVSNMTFSIAAILQVVLSMDYSIILMNRYRQEKACSPDNNTAMKNALSHAFSSITSSGMTTVIGLIMLVFMSFKIGMDLGLVLAKGVLCSMICVFTVLPVLILIFDKLIEKTAKKELNVPMSKIAGFSYRFRRVIAGFFPLLFVASAFLQGITETTYSISFEDEIADIFPTSNKIVVLYENQDEEEVASIGDDLAEDDSVNSVLSYTALLGKPYTADEMADMVKAMGADMNIDSSFLKLLYYNYYSGDTLPQITMSQMLHFISEKVVPNQMFAEYLDADIKENISQLEKFADKDTLTKSMSYSELAEFFGMDKSQVKQLFLLYYSQNGGASSVTMALPTFADFIINEVASDPTYSSMFDAATLAQMQMLAAYTDVNAVTAPMTYDNLATMLGMDAEQMKLLYVYYYAQSGYTPSSMTLPAFIQFVQTDIASNPVFSSQFDSSAMAQINQLAQLADKNTVQAQLPPAQLATAVGMEQTMVEQLFMIKFGTTEGQTMSMEEFIDYLLSDVVTNPAFSDQFDAATVQKLNLMQKVIKAVINDTAFSCDQMASMLGMDAAQLRVLYTYHDFPANASNWKLSLQTVVNFIADNSSQFGSMLGQSELAQIQMAQTIINGSVAGTQYTSQELAAIVGMDASQLDQLFLLYTSKHGNTSGWRMSVQKFVNFIVDSVLNNSAYSSKFDSETAAQLKTAQAVINAVVSEKSYTSSEMAEIFGGLSEDLDANMIELMYLYYAGINSYNDNWKLTIEQLFKHLTDDIMNDSRFASLIDNEMRSEINEAKKTLDDGIKQMKGENYSIMVVDTSLDVEGEEAFSFISNLIDNCDSQLQGNYYLIGNTPMNYEMQQSFGTEMLMITLLTALAIFIVVAITFRSISIPLILVLIVQCGVYITIAFSGVRGYSMYYLAMLIVQCILMGATIDYGILFTNYYRENRKTLDIKEAISAAYDGSTYTIFTSGLIMIIVTGILGFSPMVDPTIGQICQTIAIGVLSAMLLILFVLPSMLAAFDRFVVKKPKQTDK